MNILMLVRALPAHRKGGVPDHTWMLARGLASRGVGVEVVTTRLEGGPEVAGEAGVTVRYLPGTRPDSYAGGWWRESAASVAALHASGRFDLLHCQSDSGYGIVNTGLHRRLRLPAIVSQHGTAWDELVTRVRNGFTLHPVVAARNIAATGIVAAKFLRRDRPYLRAADAVIATSEEQHRLIAAVYGVPPGRLHKVYNGMDLTAFTPGPADPRLLSGAGIPAASPVILCVARLIRDKGVQNAVRAMPAILSRVPACRLVVIGEGPFRGELERLAEGLDVAGAVTFAGERELRDLPAWFRSCDVFVNATNQQNGYDLTMVEAMACERAVVSSRIGSTPTLIEDGTTGLLVPPGRVSSIAEAVSSLLLDPKRRAEMGARSRERVTGRFGLDAMVEGTLGVYDRVSKGEHRARGNSQ